MMQIEPPSREVLQGWAEAPIGNKALQGRNPKGNETLYQPEAKEAAERANKRWLPFGKRSTRVSPEDREAFNARQFDIEDAVERAGGARGGAVRP